MFSFGYTLEGKYWKNQILEEVGTSCVTHAYNVSHNHIQLHVIYMLVP